MKRLLTTALALAALALPALALADPAPSIHYGFNECSRTSTSTPNLASESGDPVLSYVGRELSTDFTGSSEESGDCALALNINGLEDWTRADHTTRSYYQATTSGEHANSITLSADVDVNRIGYAWQWVAGDDICNETGEISDGSCIGYALYGAGPGGAPRAYVRLGVVGANELLGVVGTEALTDHGWHNLTMTYSEGTLKLYVDGTLDGTARTSLAGETPSVLSGNSVLGVFNVGGQHINGEPGEPFGGFVDNVRFYKQALTAEEVGDIQP